ncbi:hypothetical protein EMGBS15_10450 [Filimonas sp.]|nr:hypothetical protein EMGBS15_10450 [Filimonas sp.]
MNDSNIKKAEPIYLLLLASSVFCIGLSILRIFLSGTFTYLFLNWNLFLAMIPWALSVFIADPKKKLNGWKLTLSAAC